MLASVTCITPYAPEVEAEIRSPPATPLLEADNRMQLSILFKGRTEQLEVDDGADLSELHDAAGLLFGLIDMTIKLIQRGKTLPTTGAIAAHAKPGAKLMMVASARAAMADEPRADPTVRGFEHDLADAAARCHEVAAEEVSEWGDTGARRGEWRFCRLEPCTWQSFGTRAGTRTPHAFEARKLLLKLSTDPAVVAILKQREWVVGVLGEMDPVDDRLAHKTHEHGKCLLGYNTNQGARIDVRLRTHDLSGFLPYPQLIETLLHEMAHNMVAIALAPRHPRPHLHPRPHRYLHAHTQTQTQTLTPPSLLHPPPVQVGPHDDHFWHLFVQLKVDYLGFHRDLSASGALVAGRSPLAVSGVADQVGGRGSDPLSLTLTILILIPTPTLTRPWPWPLALVLTLGPSRSATSRTSYQG